MYKQSRSLIISHTVKVPILKPLEDVQTSGDFPEFLWVDIPCHQSAPHRSYWFQKPLSTGCAKFASSKNSLRLRFRSVEMKPSQKTSSTPSEFNIAPENGWLEDCFSFWDGTFSQAMLNFRWESKPKKFTNRVQPFCTDWMRSKGDENMRKRAFKQCLLSCFASYASTYVYIYAMELCLIETVALQAK